MMFLDGVSGVYLRLLYGLEGHVVTCELRLFDAGTFDLFESTRYCSKNGSCVQ